MKGSIRLLDTWRGRRAAALMVNGRLDDLIVDPADGAPPPGTVFLARPGRPLKGLGGLFVDLPDGRRGFLRRPRGVAPGRALPVQVASYAEPGKAVPVTARITLKGRFAIATPGAPGANASRRITDAAVRARLETLGRSLTDAATGLILRSAAAAAPEDDVRDEIVALLARAGGLAEGGPDNLPRLLLRGPDSHALARRDWPQTDAADDDPGSFARHGTDAEIAALGRPEVPLPGGASAWIEPARALVAVDINTGADGSPAAGLKANIGLARALPRALRCRGLGGQIVVDPAPMSKSDRPRVAAELKRAFRDDPVETTLAGWTPLGHVELMRHRARAPVF